MTDYNTDFALWAEYQAAKLRASRFAELDLEKLAEELENLARVAPQTVGTARQDAAKPAAMGISGGREPDRLVHGNPRNSSQ